MNLKRFECFLAVAEELHFGHAAARLHMSQPPLSQQIQALERELNVKLFDRSSKHVQLTPGGEALLPEVRVVLEGTARAIDAAKRAHQGEAGTVRLGFVNPAMDGFLSHTIQAFRRGHPGVELVLKEMTSVAQLTELRRGSLHAGFVRHGWLDLTGLESALVLRERYVLALPSGHSLAKQGRVPLEAFSGLPLIMYPRISQPRLYDAMIAVFHKAGVSPRIVQETTSKHTALSLVAAGLGGALVPESTMAWRREQVRFLAVEADLPVVEIAVVWPSNPHPCVKILSTLALGFGSRQKRSRKKATPPEQSDGA